MPTTFEVLYLTEDLEMLYMDNGLPTNTLKKVTSYMILVCVWW